MVAAGEGWRRDVGLVLVVYTTVSSVAAMALTYLCRNHQPFVARGWALLFMSSFSVLLLLEVPVREVVGEEAFPCDARLWTSSLIIPSFVAPNLVSGLRVRAFCQYESLLVRVGSAKRTSEGDLEMLTRLRLALSPERSIAVCVLLQAPFFLIVAFNYALDSKRYGVGENGCELGMSAVVTLFVFAVASAVAAAYIWRLLRDQREAFGIRKELAVFAAYGIASMVLWACFKLFAGTDEDVFNSGVFVLGAALVWHAQTVFAGAWRVYKEVRYQAVLDAMHAATAGAGEQQQQQQQHEREHASGQFGDAAAVDLEEVLEAATGYHLFLTHCKREFSAENPLFYNAVRAYKALPSQEEAKEIYAKYVEPGAPLEVNLSAGTRKAIQQAMASTTGLNWFTVFDNAQGETLALMERDSLRRFVESPLYKDYREHKKRARLSISTLGQIGARSRSGSMRSVSSSQGDGSHGTGSQREGGSVRTATSATFRYGRTAADALFE